MFLWGAFLTLSLTFVSHILAILLSLPLALALNGKNRLFWYASKAYVTVFRGIPTLLLLLFVWNGFPQIWPVFREPWFSPFLAALIALCLNEAAYQVEINRAAFNAIDTGQLAAGDALGFRRRQTYRLIIIPQALRIALPPTVNEFITLLKATSLASVISLRELMTLTQQSVSSTFRYAEYYSVAACYYLAMVIMLVMVQSLVERKFAWADPHKIVTAPKERRAA